MHQKSFKNFLIIRESKKRERNQKVRNNRKSQANELWPVPMLDSSDTRERLATHHDDFNLSAHSERVKTLSITF